MKKLLWILLVLPMLANAAYNRNEARPVNEVVYGEIDTVRYITQQEIVESKANGWETLLGAAIGGLIGNQFGGGTGKEVATAVLLLGLALRVIEATPNIELNTSWSSYWSKPKTISWSTSFKMSTILCCLIVAMTCESYIFLMACEWI